MREREAEALAREREMELLNQFSAQLVSDIPIPDMVKALLVELRPITGTSCAALLFSDKAGKLHAIDASPEISCEAEPELMRLAEWAHRELKAIGLPKVTDSSTVEGGWPISVSHEVPGASSDRKDMFLPLLTATSRQGVLYIGRREDEKPYTSHDARLLVGVANQVAAFLERKSLQEISVQADALREADRLKSTLISSVSHELKTPLASVTATISGLLEGDVAWDEEGVRRELEALQEDLHRLNSSIGSLLDLSRLESKSWAPTKDWYEFGEILGTALTRIPPSQRGRISYVVPEDLPSIRVDFSQLVRAVENLLENALAYSDPGSPVRVEVTADSQEVRISVEDQGPGIPLEERERVFEKFYRGESAVKMPVGTGLGLAIAREIVRSHDGRIWVEDVVPHGARFTIALPVETDEVD
jgi:two-component system sensor histidine kinase KdpD